MATLEKIRTRGGIFIAIIIGIALLSFIISPDSLQQATMMFSSKYDVGEIAGKSISINDYQERVDYQTELYKLNSGGMANVNDQVSEQIREQVWQELINQNVFNVEQRKVGVVVTDEELTDLVYGNDPSPIIRQIFTDQQTGQLDRSRLLNVIQSLDYDPGLRAQWMTVEKQVVENQLYNKYLNLITKSTNFNSIDVKHALDASINNVEFSYVVKPYMVIDTISQVSSSELKKYYDDNKKLFERTRSRDIQYISFQIKPSADDYRFALEAIQKMESNFINTPIDELAMFVNRNSEKSFDDLYYKKGQLPVAVDTFAFAEELGAFLPIYQDGEMYNMARISGIRNLPDTVRARHILLAPENIGIADSLLTALRAGADFTAMANEYSIDQTANMSGGDLGWFSFNQMVRPFSDSCFYNPKGKIMRVRTQFGEHIVEILDKGPATKHVQVAIVQVAITPSKATSQAIFNQANSIATEANRNQKRFIELANERGYNLQPAVNIGINDRRVGSFVSARELVRWAYQSNIGDVSDVLDLDNNNYFVVATLTDIREDGIAPFEQVKAEVEVAVKKEKQAAAMIQELKSVMQTANGIDDLAQKTGLQVSNISTPVNFSTTYISGIMVPEPSLVGAVTTAPENVLSGPVNGVNGVYVFTVTNKTQREGITEDTERERLESTVLMQAYEFYNILLKSANIKDNRGKFY